MAGYPVQGIQKENDVRLVVDVDVEETNNDKKRVDHCSNDNNNNTNNSTYQSLLQQMTNHCIITPTRQTPLVNIGYAVRIACVLDSIHRFISFHKMNCDNWKATTNSSCTSGNIFIQIVILGAGMDVTGLWAILQQQTATTITIHVVEVDCPEICEMKKTALQTMEVLQQLAFSSNDISTSVVWKGCKIVDDDISHSYTLVKGDLQEEIFVNELFTNVLLHDTPTLVLSELVLSYLPCKACDYVLQQCAAIINTTRNSCIVMYEPLGYSDAGTNKQGNAMVTEFDQSISVLDSYKRTYWKQFNSKLLRGQASTKIQDKENVVFYPLGCSITAIQQRLKKNALEFVYASTAGAVGVAIPNIHWKAREPFDEHAALNLHLSSYIVVIGFGSDSMSKNASLLDHVFFRRTVCNWGIPGFLNLPKQVINVSNTTDSIWLTTVERQDESQIRQLFESTYKHLFEQYPSVHKMVNAALRKDLAVPIVSKLKDSKMQSELSSIGEYYRKLGGVFLVCVKFDKGNIGNPSHIANRHVMGAVGVRALGKLEKDARALPFGRTCYEIHRLFVDVRMQRCGLGKALLRTAMEKITERRSCKATHEKEKLFIATTPTVLLNANHFYTSMGFRIEKEVKSGDLVMSTYMSHIIKSHAKSETKHQSATV